MRNSSIVRALYPRARGRRAGAGCFSTSRDGTPCHARKSDVESPTSAPPTIKIGTCISSSMLVSSFIVFFLCCLGYYTAFQAALTAVIGRGGFDLPSAAQRISCVSWSAGSRAKRGVSLFHSKEPQIFLRSFCLLEQTLRRISFSLSVP